MGFLQNIFGHRGASKAAPSGSVVVRESLTAEAPNRNAASFLAAYKENEWLYAAVTLISSELSRTEIKLYQITGFGDKQKKVEIFQHPALDILNHPNPVQTGADLREYSAAQGEILGNSYWLVIAGETTPQPKELWPLEPRFVRVKWRETGEISHYEYQINGKLEIFQPEDVIHFRAPNPQSIYFGSSPAAAAGITIDTDIFSAKWMRNFFFGSARPDFILLFKKITKEARERIEKGWKSKFGGIENAGKMGVLEGEDMQFHTLQSSQKDMQMKEQEDGRRDKILATYRVPRDLLGLGQSSNRASIEGSTLIFSRFTILPKISRFVDQLNQELLPLFRGPQNLVFEVVNVVPEDREAKLKIADTAVKSGWMTPNEARQSFGLPPAEGGNSLLVPLSTVPLADVPGVKAAKQLPVPAKSADKRTGAERDRLKQVHLERHRRLENKFEAAIKAIFELQKKEILKELAAKAAKGSTKDINPLSPFDREKWIASFVLAATPLYELIVENGGEQAGTLIGPAAVVAFDTPAVRSFIADMSFNFATEVNETTITALRKELTEAQALGEGITAQSERVSKVFDTADTTRARVIARTETTKAMNGAAAEVYSANGVKTKEWLATEDARTRESHANADGQIQPANDTFDVGGSKLRFPGDPAGPAKEVVNCRCTILPIV